MEGNGGPIVTEGRADDHRHQGPCGKRPLVEGIEDERDDADPSNREEEDGRQRGEILAYDGEGGR